MMIKWKIKKKERKARKTTIAPTGYDNDSELIREKIEMTM
jgi:hypothetical protein